MGGIDERENILCFTYSNELSYCFLALFFHITVFSDQNIQTDADGYYNLFLSFNKDFLPFFLQNFLLETLF